MLHHLPFIFFKPRHLFLILLYKISWFNLLINPTSIFQQIRAAWDDHWSWIYERLVIPPLGKSATEIDKVLSWRIFYWFCQYLYFWVVHLHYNLQSGSSFVSNHSHKTLARDKGDDVAAPPGHVRAGEAGDAGAEEDGQYHGQHHHDHRQISLDWSVMNVQRLVSEC